MAKLLPPRPLTDPEVLKRYIDGARAKSLSKDDLIDVLSCIYFLTDSSISAAVFQDAARAAANRFDVWTKPLYD